MFTLLGGGTAAVLSSLTFLGVNFTIGENSPAFMQWGWRIPFLISAALIAIALYVRLRIDETPVFVAEKARNLVPSSADRGVAALAAPRDRSWPRAASWAACRFVYMANTYLTSVRPLPIWATPAASSGPSVRWAGWSSITFVALSATLSDRVGRRRMMLLGWAACVPWALAVIPLIDTGNPVSTRSPSSACARSARSVPDPPERSFPSCSPPATATADRHWRSTPPAIFGGALPPLIAGTLQATYGSWAIGPMLAILALASLVCTYLLPETNGTALHSAQGAGVAECPRLTPDVVE